MVHTKSDVNKRFVLLVMKMKTEGEISSYAELAPALGISPQGLSEIIKGRASVTIEILQKFCINKGVNPFYILFEKLPLKLTIQDYENRIVKSVQNDNLIDNLNDNLKGNLMPVSPILPVAAEPEVIYKPSPGTIELFVKKYGDDGVDVASSIPIGELSRLLGIEEVKELLTRLLAQLPAKK